MVCIECGIVFSKKRPEQRYCSKSCASVEKGRIRKGQKLGHRENWKYKKQTDRDGYLRVYAGRHQFSEGRLMIQEHVMIMEMEIGRRLTPGECVHHLNGIKTDNRVENLQLMTKSDHSRLHGKTYHKVRDSRGRYA